MATVFIEGVGPVEQPKGGFTAEDYEEFDRITAENEELNAAEEQKPLPFEGLPTADDNTPGGRVGAQPEFSMSDVGADMLATVGIGEGGDATRYAEQQGTAPTNYGPRLPTYEGPYPTQREGLPGITEKYTGYPLTRDAAVMAGETAGEYGGLGLGAAIGTSTLGPGGGIAGGLIGKEAGAGFGAMAASYGFDSVDEFTRWALDQQSKFGNEPGDVLLGSTEKALEEGAWAVGTMRGADYLKYPLSWAKNFGRAMFGTSNPAAEQLAKLAKRYSIPLGIVNATKSKLVKGVPAVLGVFPYIGTGLRKGRAEVFDATAMMASDLLNSSAPIATMGQMGINLTEAALKRFNKFKDLSGAMYERYYRISDNLSNPSIVPTQNLKDVADILLRNSKPLTKTTGDAEKTIIRSKLMDWLNEVKDYPETLTPRQYQEKILDLKTFIDSDVASGIARAGDQGKQLKLAMEQDFHNPVLSGLVDTERKVLSDALKRANTFFHEGMKVAESTQAKKFGTVVKNIFEPELLESGVRNADEESLFKQLFNANSTRGLRQLREVVGEEMFAESTRTFIKSALDGAITPTKDGLEFFFDPNKFSKTLKLDTEDGFKAVEEMLRGSGVKAADWKNFADIHKASGSYKVVDPSTFLQRRVTLGGAGALFSLAQFGSKGKGGSTVGKIFGTLTSLILAKKGMDLLANPEALQVMTKAFDNSLPNQQRRTLFLRGLREVLGLPKDAPIEATEEDTAWANELMKSMKANNEGINYGKPVAKDSIVPDEVMSLVSDINPTLFEKINRAISS